MEKDAARREDDDEYDEGISKESGRRICFPGQKTGGSDTVVSVTGRRQRRPLRGGERPGRRRRLNRRNKEGSSPMILLLLLLGRGRVDHVRCQPTGCDDDGVVVLRRVNDKIDGSSARKERGGEPPSSSSAVVGVGCCCGGRFETSGRPLRIRVEGGRGEIVRGGGRGS